MTRPRIVGGTDTVAAPDADGRKTGGALATAAAGSHVGRRVDEAAAAAAVPLAPSGLPAPYGIGEWGGRRLLYRGDEELEKFGNGHLRVLLIDVLLRITRVEADRDRRILDRSETVKRAANTRVMAAQKRLVVARTAAAVAEVLKAMKKSPVTLKIGFTEVAEALVDAGSGVHRATLYNRPEYRIPILKAMGRPVPDEAELMAAADPEYARVAHLIKPELVEEIRRERLNLKIAERKFAASLAAA